MSGWRAGTVGSRAARPPHRRTLVRAARPVRVAARVSIAIAAVAVLVAWSVPSLLLEHQLLILMIGFLVGLPHGAVDHLVPFWTAWLRRSAPSMLAVLVGYVVVAVLTWTGLHWAGSFVLPVLLVLSIAHFGIGDVMADRDDEPTSTTSSGSRPRITDHDRSGTALVLAVVARGGPVVVAPLLAWPDQSTQALSAVQVDFALPALWVRLLCAGVVAACVLITAGAALQSGRPRAALEVALLALLFAAVPPLAAFGIYFGAWHGLRHTARLIVRDPRNHDDLAAGKLLRPVVRFSVSAAAPTVVATVVATILVIGASQDQGLTGTVFTVLLALTVPHLVVVAALDLSGMRRRRLHRGHRPAPQAP